MWPTGLLAGYQAIVRGHPNEAIAPPMTKRALNATQVAALSDHTVHWVAPSLYLQIRPQGTRSWLFRYSRGGENQWMGLGAASDKSLSEARDEAAMLRVLVKRGGDPMAEKREVEALAKPKVKSRVPTFADCADQYIEAHRAGWKNDKHIDQWVSTLKTYAGPVIGNKPVDQVTVEDVLTVLKPIWTSKPETGSRLRGRIESVLGWATAMKFRAGDNPATWKGALSHRELLRLWADADRSSADVKVLAQTHMADLDAKIALLREMRSTLGALVDACDGDHRPDCPIIKSLEGALTSRSSRHAS
ncbi:MAG: integrase arm-type DNA-binding domain-containing protein [Devosia sp.]